VKGGATNHPRDIPKRTFSLALRVVKLCRYLEEKPGVGRTLSWQLLRAGTSIGANVEEAQAEQSRADFISKNLIALKEARETDYWLRLIAAAQVLPEKRISALRSEVNELKLILGAIVVSAKKNAR